MSKSIYYVYLLIDPRNWVPFYCGKGSRYRDKEHIQEAKKPYQKGNNKQKYCIIFSIEKMIVLMITGQANLARYQY